MINKRNTIVVVLMLLNMIIKAESSTEFTGTVQTRNGSAIPGATINLLNTNFSSTTNNEGNFTIKNIPLGLYKVSVSALGFARTIKVINLSGSSTTVKFELTALDQQLEEVVVSAQKREENPQQVPLSITTLSAQQVADYKLWNVKDITGIIPNLYSANPGDNRNVTSIRGITTTSYDPAVATYIDGVNQFGLDTYIAQLQDIERIEVLRGPQGTLYGRNAMAGVINIITKQPTNDTRGFAEFSFGNYNQQRYNIGVRTPLIKDKLFLGASGVYTGQNGFYTNQFNNQRFDDQHSFMGNYYLKLLASSKLSFILNVKHVANRNNGPFALAADKNTALGDPFTVNQNNTTELIDNIFNTSISANYSGSRFNFSSQSSYQSNYRYYTVPIDGDFSPIDGISILNNYGKDWNKVKVATQEFRFSSPASSPSPFKWVAGTYGFYQNNPVKQGTHFGEDAEMVGADFPNFTIITTNKLNRYGLAVFGQATYSLKSDLDVIIGLRYDYEHSKQSVLGEFQPDGENASINRADTSTTANFKAFSPKIGLQYRLSEVNNLFAGYSRGFRAGGISQLASDPSLPPLYPYNPESSNNFEAGSKNTLWDNRIRLNLTLFYTLVNNAQVPTLLLPDAITVIRNAGKMESKGAELELAIKPLKGLEADYNLGYTHARYTSLNVGSNGSSVNLDGNNQVFTPDLTSLFALQYGYNLQRLKVRVSARGEWKYIGQQYFDLANTITQEGYHTFNTKLGVSSKKINVFLWGTNLFDKTYIDYAYDFGAVHLGNPRTYGVSISTLF